MATSCAVNVPANLQCSICLEFFSDPRVLPCLHTYCLTCLQGLVNDQNNDLSCPQCRTKHEIPNGDVANYLSDFSILPELEIARASTKRQETTICGLCTVGEVAVGYCRDCGEYLCECCQNVLHKRGKMFVGHTTVSLEEAASLTHFCVKHDSFCSQHNEYKLEIFCTTCDTLVCSMCMLETTHKGHSYDFLKNVQVKLMERIKSMTVNIREKEKKLRTCLAFVEKFEQQTCSQRDQLEAKINAASEEYIRKIQSMKDDLLKQVESTFTTDSKTIWATKNDLQIILSQVESCQAFSTRYQKLSNDVTEISQLSLLNQLLHQLSELDSADVDLSAILHTSTFRTKIKKPSQNLKIVQFSISEYSGKLEKAKVKLGQKSTLVYLLNEPLAQVGKWECKYGPKKKLTSTCKVVAANDKRLNIEFTPTLPLKYSFQLTSVGTLRTNVPKFSISLDCIGARVKRGPDWVYNDQDGGPGNLGTVVGPCEDKGFDFWVIWDITKEQYGYRWGTNGKYELEVAL